MQVYLERSVMTMENWQEQLRRGGLDLAILGSTVAPEPRYGFEIIRLISRSPRTSSSRKARSIRFSDG